MSVPTRMNAVGFTESLPIDEENSLFSFTLPVPSVSENDILVRLVATSINPADAKNRWWCGFINHQNGFTTARMTMAISANTGSSLKTRKYTWPCVLRPSLSFFMWTPQTM